ncbi:PepSY-associated TM helix domain-containing protein [Jeotgalibacillus proteolyticus]|uniref:PepSY domain-containing protein n=1 Tax=Jeotgalibacillus proteolyticus TaxID=2082395 RepID=A0A2S5GD06_9BACL|nr:PepSY domain-containing protein [Jeotgalibacillus proteolyticus]PPA70886.1 PepSY domain-containing protein [Jeotgalibacillus proteolyticus]
MRKEKEKKQTTSPKNNRAAWYQAVWRWHFYAGLFASPFLLILAFSGGVYLFKPQIEGWLYQDQYRVSEMGSQALPASVMLGSVKESYPEASVTAYKVYEENTRTVEVGIMDKGVAKSVYLNPYTANVQGELITSEKFTEIFKKLHSELIVGGTFANRLVELAACWTIILLITGLYMWWPRNIKSVWGTVLPRLNARGRMFWRDLHAVPAFWFSIMIVVLIATGLPWSGVMGEQINRLAVSTNSGYPAFAHSFGEKPLSAVRAEDVAEDVPWASQNNEVPASVAGGYQTISIDDVTMVASMEKVAKPYTISMPMGEDGVYTIAASHNAPWDNATLHLDQYTGGVLSDVRFSDYGMLAKGITAGIALHEGRLFGWFNQFLGLITCLAIIGIVISSFIMWRKRKPEGLGSPKKPVSKKVTRTLFIGMIIGGIIMPLVGLSIILVVIFDWLIVKRVPTLQRWFHGKTT